MLLGWMRSEMTRLTRGRLGTVDVGGWIFEVLLENVGGQRKDLLNHFVMLTSWGRRGYQEEF